MTILGAGFGRLSFPPAEPGDTGIDLAAACFITTNLNKPILGTLCLCGSCTEPEFKFMDIHPATQLSKKLNDLKGHQSPMPGKPLNMPSPEELKAILDSQEELNGTVTNILEAHRLKMEALYNMVTSTNEMVESLSKIVDIIMVELNLTGGGDDNQ